MKKHLLVALSVLCLCSCFEEKKVVEKPKENIVAKQETKPAPEKNDKYVYIDAYKCLHTKKDCSWHINQENWERPTHAINFVLKCELEPNDVRYYCRECVDVEHFEEIKEITPLKDDIRNLYDALLKNGYNIKDLGGSEESFRESMGDANLRGQFYDWVAGREDFNIGSREAFERRMTGALDY